MHLRIVLGVVLRIGLAFVEPRVRVSVEIDDLELVFESSTLGLEFWLESSAFRLGLRLGLRLCLG